jgi:hypothetical protein
MDTSKRIGAARRGEKAIPSRKVGSHRRVLLTDLLSYRKEFEAKRHEALDELVALSQELGLGY